MNYCKLETENSYTLLVKSMSKLHTITHISFNEIGHNKLYKNKSLIGVATLHQNTDATALALQYSGDTDTKLECKGSENKSFTGFYMQAYDGNYYQIAGIFNDVDEANKFMLNREDTALIDSTKIKGLENQFHFIASLEKSKVKK